MKMRASEETFPGRVVKKELFRSAERRVEAKSTFADKRKTPDR